MEKFQYVAYRLCRRLEDPLALEEPLPEIHLLESAQLVPTYVPPEMPSCDLLMEKFQYVANRLCRHLADPLALEEPLPEIHLLESAQLVPTYVPTEPPSCDLLMEKFQYVANRLCRHLGDPVALEEPLPEIHILESVQLVPTYVPTESPSCDLLMEKFQYVANRLCRHLADPVALEEPLPEIHLLESVQLVPTAQPEKPNIACPQLDDPVRIEEPLSEIYILESARLIPTAPPEKPYIAKLPYVEPKPKTYLPKTYLQMIGSIHPITKFVHFHTRFITDKVATGPHRKVYKVTIAKQTSTPDMLREFIQNQCIQDFNTYANVDLYIENPYSFERHVVVQLVFYNHYLKLSGRIHARTHLIEIHESAIVDHIDIPNPGSVLNIPNDIQLPIQKTTSDDFSNAITKYISYNSVRFNKHDRIDIYLQNIYNYDLHGMLQTAIY
jgi:hypothetical protein